MLSDSNDRNATLYLLFFDLYQDLLIPPVDLRLKGSSKVTLDRATYMHLYFSVKYSRPLPHS